MAVGTVQLFNNGPLYLMDGHTGMGKGWVAAGSEAGRMIGALCTNTTLPLDTMDAWSSLSATQATDSLSIYTPGGVAIETPTVAVNTTPTPDVYQFGSATWSTTTASGTTITAKFFIVAQRQAATATLLVSGDKLIFWVDLNTDTPGAGGTSVSSSNGAFQVSPHATNGWFQIPFQA